MTTLSLTQMIADLNAKIAAADSSTSIATLLEYATEAEKLGGGTNIYDSAGVLPSDSAYEGSIAYIASDAELRVRGDVGWAAISDSAFETPPPHSLGGTISGYTSGGFSPSFTPSNKTIGLTITKFPFSSDANATDVGDLTVARYSVAGQSSSSNGYTTGGSNPPDQNVIDKFPFSSDGNASDVGDLTFARTKAVGQSSETSGYTSGGKAPSPNGGPNINSVEKFAFASDANASDVGDLTKGRYSAAGQSSSDNGYTSGGDERAPLYESEIIDKFSFASDANTTDVGNLTSFRNRAAGQSSSSSGYTAGGVDNSPTLVNTIDKFPFATDANATDVGDLTGNRADTAGQSSTLSGYTSGGIKKPPSPAQHQNIIDKFPFVSDANATDVGDLTAVIKNVAGQQV